MTSREKKPKKDRIGTPLVHSGEMKEAFGSVVTPIYRATTYDLTDDIYPLTKKYGKTEDPSVEIDDRELKQLRYHMFYARDANPNVAVVQRKMAMIEGCEDAVATSSGMGGISSTILSLIKGKKYIVSTPHLYGTAYSFIFGEMREMLGIKVVSLEDFISKKWIHKIKGDDMAAIYVETLSNPFLVIPPLDDLRGVRDELCPEVPIVVDNTFLTPVNFRPFSLLDPARDMVLSSVTKYLAGHSDASGGIVCGSLSKINKVWEKMSLYGCCLDGETAYYVERSLKTLHLRMERHNKNMVEVYDYLAGMSEKFDLKIFHPLSGQHPIPRFAHPLVEQKRLGGMITFNINGKSEKDGIQFMKRVHKRGVIRHATSLGGVESLISMPYNMSQSSWAQQEALGLKRYGCLLRLSVGIEDANDIIASLDEAFRSVCR